MILKRKKDKLERYFWSRLIGFDDFGYGGDGVSRDEFVGDVLFRFISFKRLSLKVI